MPDPHVDGVARIRVRPPKLAAATYIPGYLGAVGDAVIGGRVIIIATSAVEAGSGLATARAVKTTWIAVRGGVFEARTSPYSLGLGEEGLEILSGAAEFRVVTEMTPSRADAMEGGRHGSDRLPEHAELRLLKCARREIFCSSAAFRRSRNVVAGICSRRLARWFASAESPFRLYRDLSAILSNR
jgi:hypothetical protein